MIKTIVSLTPVALDRDSRALKIAHSFSQWGYQSIVVEGEQSTIDFSKYGMQIISLREKKEEYLDAELIVNQNFLIKFLKWIWRQLKRKNFTILLNYASFYMFKKNFRNQYLKNISEKIPDADIYYLHSYEYFFAIKKKIKKNQAKLIYDAHDFYMQINPDKSFLGASLIKNFQKNIEQFLIRSTDLMFTVSEGLKKLYINQYNIIPFIIRNAHCSNMDCHNVNTIKTHYGLNKNDLLTVIIGNQKEGQALNQIIKTFLDCTSKNNYLIFIGGGYDSLKESLSHKDLERILFLSRLQPTHIVSIASEANFGILPYFALTDNYKYALPNGFFQMIASQLPILFSKDLLEISALNDREHFGVGTDFHSPDELKKDLKYFFSNFSKKDALSAKQHLTWENEKNILRDKILKMIESK